MLRRLSIIIALIIVSLNVSAQKPYAVNCVDVGGIVIERLAPRSVFVEKFGEPDEIVEDEATGSVAYVYGNSVLRVNASGILVAFYVDNNKFSLFDNIIPGGIRVGDAEDEVKNKIKHFTKDSVFTPYRYKDGSSGFKVGGGDFYMYFETKDGVLSSVDYDAELN